MPHALVTETFAYDDGRRVTVSIPPEPAEAIIFAGDGQLIAPWGTTLATADVPPTMLVGVHRVTDETLRLHEYSPAFDPERFAAHEQFFVEEVAAWVRSRFGVDLPAARTAVLGVSAGGELALAVGLRHPDRYGAIFAASPGGGYRPPAVLPPVVPQTYLVAGTQEPFFWRMRPAGRTRCARARYQSCYVNATPGTTMGCGVRSSHRWSPGRLGRAGTPRSRRRKRGRWIAGWRGRHPRVMERIQQIAGCAPNCEFGAR